MVPFRPRIDFRAFCTVFARVAFNAPASCAVAPCVTTPTDNWAWSGVTLMVAVPVAWTVPGVVCAGRTAPAISTPIKIAKILRIVSSSFKYSALSADCCVRHNTKNAVRWRELPFTEIYGRHRNQIVKLEFNRDRGEQMRKRELLALGCALG